MPIQKITFSQDAELHRTIVEEESKTIDIPESSDLWLRWPARVCRLGVVLPDAAW